mgnify:CR=1 FL=1
MINFLIFSKNRAAQLDLLLRSLQAYCRLDNFKVSILYKETVNHKESYNKCIVKHSYYAEFIKEQNFKNNFINQLNEEYTCLLTDDTVFFNTFNNIIYPKYDKCFSLRLGYNTVVQNHFTNQLQPPLFPDEKEGNVISWNPSKYSNCFNFGYPFSFDGHIYQSKLLLDILSNKDFQSTNDAEGILNNNRNIITKVYCFEHSCCVNVPCNNLSGLTDYGKIRYYGLDELRDNYERGYSLYFNEEEPILGCHQELEFLYV